MQSILKRSLKLYYWCLLTLKLAICKVFKHLKIMLKCAIYYFTGTNDFYIFSKNHNKNKNNNNNNNF